LRALPGARAQIVGISTKVTNHIRGAMKVFGLLVVGVRGTAFASRVEELVLD
jgi:transposase